MRSEWLPCPFDTKYEVTEHGRVRRVSTGRELKPKLTDDGYVRVRLPVGWTGVHRLVLAAWVSLPPGLGYEADHLDNDKSNNHWTNLEWVTKSENIRRAVKRGRRPSRGHVKLTDVQVVEIKRRLLSEPGAKLAREFGVNKSTVHHIKIGRTWRGQAMAEQGCGNTQEV